MSKEVMVHGDLNVAGSMVMSVDNVGFPLNPKQGQFLIKGANLYAYLTIGGIQTWYPLVNVNSGNTYLYTQSTPVLEWVIVHNLNSIHLWSQVQDQYGNILYPQDVIFVDVNTVRVVFTEPVQGTVIVVGVNNVNLDNIIATLINIGSNVTIDTSGMIINGSRVLNTTGVNAAIAAALANASGLVISVGGYAGAVTKTQLGIDNVDNVLDINKPVSTLQAAADNITLTSANTFTTNAVASEAATRTIADNNLTASISTVQSIADSAQTTANIAATNAAATTIALSTETSRALAVEALLVPKTTTVNGLPLSGNVILTPSDVGAASIGNNIFTGAQSLSQVNKGTVTSGTVNFNISAGNIQKLTVGGALSIAFNTWVASGICSDLLIELVNGGAYIVTMPVGIIWQLPTTGAPAASFLDYLTAIGRTSLQSAGTDFLYFWSADGGTTIYGKLM